MKQDKDIATHEEPKAPSRARRAYQKPAFRCEKIFETMALSCGKVQSTQSGCHSNRKNS